jgi:RNA polymerase sigma-70 factor (ECF subfamily)
MSGTAPSDSELVARCRDGDRDAWAVLVERYSRYVYAISVQGFRLSGSDAEDVFQDVFLRVYERLGTLRNDESLRPWIAQVTRRVCLDRLALAGRRDGVGSDGLADGDSTADLLAVLEEAIDVHEALANLDPVCRELLDRFFTRDEPYRVIADALDLPMGTVASRISRCLGKVRERLGEGRNEPVRQSGGLKPE